MTIPVVLDCDPGHDDAIAILLAGASDALDLRAVTTVGGNQSLEKITLNACRVLTVAGLAEVPLAAGAAKPLTRPLRVAADVHGESGLDGPEWPEPTARPLELGAVELLRRTIIESAEPVALIATGPLTNVATLLLAHPEVAGRIREISWMGGSAGRGNVTPLVEFNASTDPEAARIVFGSGLPLTMCGLDVTHQALVTPAIVDRLRALGTAVGDMSVELMRFFAATYRELFGFEGPPLHDPVAVARVVDPTLVRAQRVNVEIETRGDWTAGATVVDLAGRTGREANADVALELDVERFWDLVVGAIAVYG
ncbi:nucleoside hydrolase [Saccharopolyspora erythraea]|uniref:nucleoside hydrolase n=1 Tax=Saccharopolyspora erythraea TaxID=1836 RepID=UPI001BAB19E4|nr:nucleoside hydrolase [Saccharopolyspora erythraea]QUH00439.1 nucleoside hydrolase [Saccharopolyspora erythraea]